MLRALKALLHPSPATSGEQPGEFEQRQLRAALASLLAELVRVDFEVRPEELSACRAALADLLEIPDAQAQELIEQARETSARLTSYFGPVSVINRWFTVPQRVRFVEHLWRVAYSDGGLDPYEDHLVRKLSHLLYVPHIDMMLARQRARGAGTPAPAL